MPKTINNREFSSVDMINIRPSPSFFLNLNRKIFSSFSRLGAVVKDSPSINMARVRFPPRRYRRVEFVDSVLCWQGYFPRTLRFPHARTFKVLTEF